MEMSRGDLSQEGHGEKTQQIPYPTSSPFRFMISGNCRLFKNMLSCLYAS